MLILRLPDYLHALVLFIKYSVWLHFALYFDL